jgi:hypothetical protein
MLLRILDHVALRALTAGVFYALFMIVANQAALLVGRQLHSRPRLTSGHVSHGAGWAMARQVAALVFAAGFCFALLLEGTFAANDVGIVPIDWPKHGPWLAVLIAGTIGLIAAFWAPHWRAAKGPESTSTRVLESHDGPGSLIEALADEASLVVFRAATIPLLGGYWGIWFGLAWRLALRWLNRRRRAGLSPANGRAGAYLASALDWLAATLFVITGSLWACLLGRLLCQVAAQIIYRWSIGSRRREAASIPSGEDEGQDNQDSEHDSGQDGDTLQVP